MEKTNIAILLLCGCPCTGKTYFLKRFKTYIETNHEQIQVVHINFDKIINSNLEQLIIRISFWKESRILIQNLIKKLISYLKTNIERNINLEEYFDETKNLLFDTSSSNYDINKEIYSNFIKLLNDYDFKRGSSNHKYLLCLDDNLYYESMRFKYYQLAKQEKCSYYCLCFKIRTLNKLLKLNHNRSKNSPDNESFRVTDTIIENMFTKFNYPNLIKWEKELSLIVEYDENLELELDLENLFDSLIDLTSKLFSSFNLLSLTNDETEQKVSIVNIKHQSDLIMRRIIKESLNKVENKKAEALKLNILKSDILERLNKKDDKMYIELNSLFLENLIVYENYLCDYFLKLTRNDL